MKKEKRIYQFGPFRLDAEEQLLLCSGERVYLAPKDFELLLLLIKNRGHILEKEELMKEVWPDAFVEEGNLNRHISTIRKRLGENHDKRQYIETVPRRGYRFIAHVRDLQQESDSSNDSDGAAPAIPVKERAARTRPIDSLAVLPMINASSDPKVEYLSEGITDSVINTLSRLPQLRVMARSIVSRYRGREVDPQMVARELGVSAVMVGRLLEFGNNLIVKVELVDAEDGSQLWGEQYSRKSSDIFTIQEEISQKISKKLRLRLTDEQKRRLSKRYTESNEAYQAYLMGCFLINKRTADGLRNSVKHFERAIELDPQYALAYVGLTDAYYHLRDYNLLPLKDSLSKARAMALRAISLDPSLAEAHIALAHIKRYDWDWAGMEAEYLSAIKISPNLASAHKYYSVLLRQTGRFEEARAEIQKAQELDPVSPNILATAAANFYFARHYDRALKEILKVIELEPGMPSGHFVAGWIYTQQARYTEAIEAFQKAASLLGYDNPEIESNLACAYALSGRTKKARQLLSGLLEAARQDGAHAYQIALVYSALGDKEQAFTYLERACDERSTELGYLKGDPLLDSLRTDSRFTSLLRRVGVTA
ncbi:MAG TPA: winged helix-turn-helix domain-containing protein [Pyrinomonadaceae bacterium]|nr:winged helix-turn-helix domain-containing protein [Pyrinomonadaceae bacterium]